MLTIGLSCIVFVQWAKYVHLDRNKKVISIRLAKAFLNCELKYMDFAKRRLRTKRAC